MPENDKFALIPTATAQELIRAAAYLQRSGVLSPQRIDVIPSSEPRIVEEPLQFINQSGGEIPRYACMQIIGTHELADRTVLIADQPADTDGTSGGYLFNGHHAVADQAIGTAQRGRHVRAIAASGSTLTAGLRFAPVVGAWTIMADTSGFFVMAGADSLIDDGCKIFLDGGCC